MSYVSNNTQPKVWMNGQYMSATQDKKSGKWFVVIDGKQIEVNPNDLFGVNSSNKDLKYWPKHFIQYYDELIADNEEKKSFLEATVQHVKEQIKSVKAQYDSFMCSLGVNKIDDITDESKKAEAKKYYNSLSDLNSDKTRYFNELYSTCMRQLDNVLNRSEWQNQLSLAEHIMNS